jgi:signal transduction histidine kinase
MLNDLLDFSKIEAGKLELEPADFSLKTVLGGTLRTLALRVHMKGLGLAIAVRLAELMGGMLTADSQPDRGNTFTFTTRFGRPVLPPEPAPAGPRVSRACTYW